MKHRARLICVMLATVILCGCSSVKQSDYDALLRENGALQKQVEDLTAENEKLSEQIKEIQKSSDDRSYLMGFSAKMDSEKRYLDFFAMLYKQLSNDPDTTMSDTVNYQYESFKYAVDAGLSLLDTTGISDDTMSSLKNMESLWDETTNMIYDTIYNSFVKIFGE